MAPWIRPHVSGPAGLRSRFFGARSRRNRSVLVYQLSDVAVVMFLTRFAVQEPFLFWYHAIQLFNYFGMADLNTVLIFIEFP